MYQLDVTLLSLVLTLFFPLSVEVTGATVPTQARAKEALQTVAKYLKDDIGSNWLANVSKDRVKPLTTEELMGAIINSTESNDVRGAAEIIALALEQQRTNGKTNESLIVEPEGFKEFIETVADRDDIICIYRKVSRLSTRRSEEWEKIMTDLSTDYSIYLALDTGRQYVLCVKKIESNTTSTTIESITEITRPNEGIIVNSTSEITPKTLEMGAGGLSKRSPKTLNRYGTMKVSRTVDRNNSVDNEDEEIRERDSGEDCGSESASCTSSLISSALFASSSPESDSESIESTSTDEDESIEGERRLMRGISSDDDKSVGKEINRETPCTHRIQIFTRHNSQDHYSRNDNVKKYINGRYSMQEIPNSRKLPISSGGQLHKTSNYELYICQFNEICQQIKSPESQQGLMNNNNKSPEGLLNLQPRFLHNTDEFRKNLHDNGILTHQLYPTHVDTHYVVLKRNNNDGFSNPSRLGYHPTQHSVKPSSTFVTHQLLRGDYPGISRNLQNIHVHRSLSHSNTNTGQIDVLGDQENDDSQVENDGLLSLKIFVNNPPKKPVKLSIYMGLDPEIEVYHNKDHYLDNGLNQAKFKVSKQPGESFGEQKVHRSITKVDKIEKQNSGDDFDELMDLLTSNY